MIPHTPEESASRPPAGAARHRRVAVYAAVALVAALGAAAVWWLAPSSPPRPSDGDDLEVIDSPRPQNPGYLGAQACAECHADRVAEFQQTRHARAATLPDPESAPAGFAPGRGTFTSRVPGLRFEMTREGGELVQQTVLATPSGERKTSSPVGLVYGAGGKADEVYFTWHGDRLFELPMAWLHPRNCWAEEPRSPQSEGDFSRTTTTRCLECHNTWVEHTPGSENEYRRDSFILGVSCERCHGSGRDHVAARRAGPDADPSDPIVHPGRLSRDRKLDLCGQCHTNAEKPRGPAFSYRPGEPLEDHFRTARVRHREEDHVADQVKYLRQSKCFQKSDTLVCTTCHNPHRPQSAAATRAACLKCHEPSHCPDQPRLPAAVRGDCVGCHMPQFTRIQVLFHTEDDQYVPTIRPYDHRIAVHPRAREEVLLHWHRTQPDPDNSREADRLGAELVAEWLAEAEGFRREYRFLAAIGAAREALRLGPTPEGRETLQALVTTQSRIDAGRYEAFRLIEERRFPEAVEKLEALLRVKPDLAQAHGRLGTLHATAGHNELAVKHLRQAARCDPDDAYGDSMLGWLAYLGGRSEEALEAYRRAEAIEPWNAKINHHTGLVLVQMRRPAEAADRFRRALTIDPNHAGACHSLAETLRHQGQPAEALRYARRAAQLTRFRNLDALRTLAEAFAENGRYGEAADAGARALDVARTTNPQSVPEISRLVEGWKRRAKKAPT